MPARGNPRCVSVPGWPSVLRRDQPPQWATGSSACTHHGPLTTAQRASQAARNKPTPANLKIQTLLLISDALVLSVAHRFICIDFTHRTTLSMRERGTRPITYMTPHALQAWFQSYLFQCKSEATPRYKKDLHKIRFSPYVRMPG